MTKITKNVYYYKCIGLDFNQIVQASKLLILNNHHVMEPNINNSTWTFYSFSTINQIKNVININIELIK
jgi:hypothetical protein